MDRIDEVSRKIARKYFPHHDACGGGMHYDSCSQCNLANEIRAAVQELMEEEWRLIERMKYYVDHLRSCDCHTTQTEEICDCGYKQLYREYLALADQPNTQRESEG